MIPGLSRNPKFPKLVVFDLDYTLWPFYIDTHVTPPFRRSSDGKIVDHFGKKVEIYPQVPEVLEHLHREGVEMAVASRTTELKGAQQLTSLLGWDKYFKYKEIYPGSKVAHFQKLKEYTGLAFSDMLFFDDESRNITDLKKLNVTSILVNNGMTMPLLMEGLNQFARSSKF